MLVIPGLGQGRICEHEAEQKTGPDLMEPDPDLATLIPRNGQGTSFTPTHCLVTDMATPFPDPKKIEDINHRYGSKEMHDYVNHFVMNIGVPSPDVYMIKMSYSKNWPLHISMMHATWQACNMNGKLCN